MTIADQIYQIEDEIAALRKALAAPVCTLESATVARMKLVVKLVRLVRLKKAMQS